MAQSQWRNSCCNPFDHCNHSYKRKNLRPVAKWMCERAPSISLHVRSVKTAGRSLPLQPMKFALLLNWNQKVKFMLVPDSLASLNQCLGKIGETPISKHKLQRSNYPKQKIKKITTAMKRVMLGDESSDESNKEGEIIKQLKERFHTKTKKSERCRLYFFCQKVGQLEKLRVSFVHPTLWIERRKILSRRKESWQLLIPSWATH